MFAHDFVSDLADWGRWSGVGRKDGKRHKGTEEQSQTEQISLCLTLFLCTLKFLSRRDGSEPVEGHAQTKPFQ